MSFVLLTNDIGYCGLTSTCTLRDAVRDFNERRHRKYAQRTRGIMVNDRP